jgi:beta-lactamase class A
MRRGLIPLLLVVLLSFACGLDVSDKTPTPAPGNVASSTSPLTGSAEPPLGIATPRPTREPVPIGTPAGTTGLLGWTPAPVTHDQACLDGEDPSESYIDGRLTGRSRSAGIKAPAPYMPIAFEQDDELQAALEAAMGDEADDYAFFVKDLTTGLGAGHDVDRVFNAASTFKLLVMYEVFHQQDQGLFDWDKELVITPYYDANGLSPRVTELCQVITVADALDAMLSVSDNAAAVLLQDLVGVANVNNAINALGLTQSGLFPENLAVTAADLSLLLEAISRGEAVSPEASADMVQLLLHDVFNNGLVAGLPPGSGAVVAHKTGNWSDATNDAGLVYTDWGAYAFVAHSDVGYETSVIRAASTAVYEHFEEAHRGR